MAYKVVFRPFAENDLVALYQYIAENSSPDRAAAYIGRIEHACMSLADFPFRGAKRDDLHPGLRDHWLRTARIDRVRCGESNRSRPAALLRRPGFS